MVEFDFKGKRGKSGQKGTKGYRGKDATAYWGEGGKTIYRGNGRNGGQGGEGTSGQNGQPGPFIEAHLSFDGEKIKLQAGDFQEIITEPFTINASGGDGGYGGNGGDGGKGGKGEIDGISGVRGKGGRGGNGGNGGDVSIFAEDPFLLALANIIVKPGKGGSGGSGSPSGKKGFDGEEGRKRFVYEHPNGPFETEGFGLSIIDHTVKYDGSDINGHVTRNSELVIDTVTIKNHYDIPLKGEMSLQMDTTNHWIEIGEEAKDNTPNVYLTSQSSPLNVKLNPNGNTVVKTNLKIRIAPDASLGEINFTLKPVAIRGDVVISLAKEDYNSVTQKTDVSSYSFNISVNDRFNLSKNNFEDIDKDFWENIAGYYNSLSAIEQNTAINSFLLNDVKKFIRKQKIESNLKEHIQKAAKNFGSRLFRFEVYKDLQKEEMIKEIQRKKDLGKAIAVDFLRKVSLDFSEATLDGLFFASTINKTIKQEQKDYIRELTIELPVKEAWLKENYPVLFEKGDTEITAKGTNKMNIWYLPAFVALFALLFRWIFFGWQEIQENFLWNISFTSWELNNLAWPFAGIMILFIIGIYLGRLAFIRIACRNCGSIHLEKFYQSNWDRKETSFFGDSFGGQYKCKDCLTRGTTEDEHNVMFYNPYCMTANNSWIKFTNSLVNKTFIIILNIISLLICPVLYVLSFVWFVSFKQARIKNPLNIALYGAIVLIAGFIVLLFF